jgi:WD40 repeat protein
MTLARDRVIKSGDFIYHMYYDEAIKISTYSSALSTNVEFLGLDTTSFTVRFGGSVETNPDISICSDFTLKKSYKDEVSGGPVNLIMNDAHGDGWDGFLLGISGTQYGDSFSSGTRQTTEITGLSGSIEVTKDADGKFPGEVSWELRCAKSNVLLLSGDSSDSSWTFVNTCPTELTDAIVIRHNSAVVATLTEIEEFSVTGASGVYTYSDITDSSIGGSLTIVDCTTKTRLAVLDDFFMTGTAVRHDYDFGSDIPFMPCQDGMSISREHAAHPLLPEMSSVNLDCNVFAQKEVTENDKEYFKSYQIMCGVCTCEESSQTGNWTGYDCRTPALGFFKSDARSQCPGMTADMNPCNGGGTCRWGSTDGLGIQIRSAATRCYCGDVTDEATLETAPRSEYGVLVHASSYGIPLFYDEIDEFGKVDTLIEYSDIQPQTQHCDQNDGGFLIRARPYADNSDNPGTDEESWKKACYDACANVDGANIVSTAGSYNPNFWDEYQAYTMIVERTTGSCFCIGRPTEDCSPGSLMAARGGSYDAYGIRDFNICPSGTEPIEHAKDCRHGFKTDEPYSLIPSFQFCEMPDKSDQVLTISTQTENVDTIVFNCYESCINGQKTIIAGADSDPLFWSKHTKEDITHFSVTTSGSFLGRCVCYATNVDDCKNGAISVTLSSYPQRISYRIKHHSHPYDLTTEPYITMPTLSSLTTGSCQKKFEEEVFLTKEYGPSITYVASSSVCKEVFEIDGTSLTLDNSKLHLGKVYSERLQDTDPLYDRDPSQECANRCHARKQDYDGFMVLSYAPSGNINSCLCGKNCDTPKLGHPYFKVYSMRTVPDPYDIDKTKSVCHPSPLHLTNYKSDCSCKFGFTGNTCETPRMMCLWDGEETDGTECICKTASGDINPKVSKYGCCTKGTYWDQDKYASFTPLSDFEPLPENRFYQDAFLYVCKPPETLLDYENDQQRILDIHNYVANTDEYLFTKPAVCGDAPEKQLFTSTFQTLTSKSPETFTVTRDDRSIVVDKDKTILELKEGSKPKEQCAAFCVSKNKGYKGFSVFTPTPTFQRSEDGPGHSDMTTEGGMAAHDPPFSSAWCEDDDRVQVYTGWFYGDYEDPNPGRQLGLHAVIDACFAGCTFRPRVAKSKVNGYADSRPQNFWDVYGPDDISYIRISDSVYYNNGFGACYCHTGDLDTCEKVEDPPIHTHDSPKWKQYYYHNYKVVRGDTECTCEPFIANMDNQTVFKDPMSYEDNEGWYNALPRTTERYDIQFPVDIEAESQNLGCFENIDGRVLKIDQLAGTSNSISATKIAYVDTTSARSSVDGTFEDCYEECKSDDVFTYGFPHPELPRYNFEGKGSCISPDTPFLTNSAILKGSTGAVSSVSFSPDGSRIVSGSANGTVRVWDSQTGNPIGNPMTEPSEVNSVSFSPNGSRIVSGSANGTVRVWNATSGELLTTLEGHIARVFSVSFSPNGSRIVSGSADSTVRVWNSHTGNPIGDPIRHDKFVSSVSFSPDGSRIVSGSWDDKVRVWDAVSGGLLKTLVGHTSYVFSVSFSPDGSRIVSGSGDKTVRVWNSHTGALIRTLTGHTDWVISVSFSPDGSHIVSGSADKTVRVWDVVSGGLLSTLVGHTDVVYSVSFSPEGSRIVSGSGDNTVQVWSRGTEGGYLESLSVSGASACYKNCRYKAGFSGFVFKPVDGRCVCTTTAQKGCFTAEPSYDRYSKSDDYMMDQFTEVTKDGSDGFCYGMPGVVRTYEGTGDNPGEDLAGKTRACYDTCANVDDDDIVSAVTTNSNPNFWAEYTRYDVVNWLVKSDGRCYCYTDADDKETCEKDWIDIDAGYDYDVYRRKPPPEQKTCTCYSRGQNQIVGIPFNNVFQVSGTSVGTLMSVQKSPAVNPAPCNVNSYVALGDDIVGDSCNCPIGALEEAYVDTGFERAIVNGRCNDYTSAEQNFQNPCPSSHPYLGGPYSGNQFWCYVDASANFFPCNMHNSGKPPPPGYIWGSNQPDCVLTYELLAARYRCINYKAPSGPSSGGYALFLDPSDPLASTDRAEECSNRCSAEGYTTFYLLKSWGGRCMCGSDSCSSRVAWDVTDSYTIKTYTRSTTPYSGSAKLSKEQCETACENDPHCDSFSYAKDDPSPCRTAIDCAGFEYKFEGLCGGSPAGIKADRTVGVLPNIQACRDMCADYRGFAYSENYKRCICEDNEMIENYHSTCGNGGSFVPSVKYTRYQHNFEPAQAGEDAIIYVKQQLTKTKGRYCATGEEKLYTVSITDPRADAYACAQEATLRGMEVARGSTVGLIFTCYVSDTYYANPDVPEAGVLSCNDLKPTGGPQYILQAGMQRRIGNELATAGYQNKAIKDDLFNSELYPSDTAEGCKVHCDPYKYRHFQFSNRAKTCQCIKKEKSLLTLTGDPNSMDYEIYDFTAGLIDSPHEMCFCEGFYLVDGQAQSCPAGKYSSKLTPCSAECTTCSAGQFSDAGASECGTCVAGQYQTSPTSCSKCPSGYFARAGDIECKLCEIGRYATGVGAGECTLCPTGKFQDPAVAGTTTNTCKDCPAGWEQPNLEQIDCKLCGIGKYTTSVGTTSCSTCGVGKYQNQNGQTSAGACHDCLAGTYQNQNGQSGCVSCPRGWYQSQTGKSACAHCVPGRYRSSVGGTSCTYCEAGKYQGSNSATVCSNCPKGYYASGSGKTLCVACSHGQYQNQNGQSVCKPCEALWGGYTWVASPFPHTSEDLSCDQYKPCVWGRATPDCGHPSYPPITSHGNRDKRACCHYQTNYFREFNFFSGNLATGNSQCSSSFGGGFGLDSFTRTGSGRGGWRACEPPKYGI